MDETKENVIDEEIEEIEDIKDIFDFTSDSADKNALEEEMPELELTTDVRKTEKVRFKKIENLLEISDDEFEDLDNDDVISREKYLAQKEIEHKQRAAKKSANERFNIRWMKLKNAMQKQMLLTGTITSIREASTTLGEAKAKIALAVVRMEGFDKNIVIPFFDMYKDNPIDKKEINLKTAAGREEFFHRQYQLLRSTMGAKVNFVVKKMSWNGIYGVNSSTYIQGSRKLALEMEENAKYTSRKGEEPFVKEGEEYTAQIIARSQSQLYINLHGLDMWIPVRLLTYNYIPDLRDEKLRQYAPGENINVRVASIKQSTEGYSVTVERLSIELEEAGEHVSQIGRGEVVKAVITSIRKKRGTNDQVIIGFIDQYHAPVNLNHPESLTRDPVVGDVVFAKVLTINSNNFIAANLKGFA